MQLSSSAVPSRTPLRSRALRQELQQGTWARAGSPLGQGWGAGRAAPALRGCVDGHHDGSWPEPRAVLPLRPPQGWTVRPGELWPGLS